MAFASGQAEKKKKALAKQASRRFLRLGGVLRLYKLYACVEPGCIVPRKAVLTPLPSHLRPLRASGSSSCGVSAESFFGPAPGKLAYNNLFPDIGIERD